MLKLLVKTTHAITSRSPRLHDKLARALVKPYLNTQYMPVKPGYTKLVRALWSAL